jgi:hypothetical protein
VGWKEIQKARPLILQAHKKREVRTRLAVLELEGEEAEGGEKVTLREEVEEAAAAEETQVGVGATVEVEVMGEVEVGVEEAVAGSTTRTLLSKSYVEEMIELPTPEQAKTRAMLLLHKEIFSPAAKIVNFCSGYFPKLMEKNLDFIEAKPLGSWNTAEVCLWLESIQLGPVATLFEKEDITGAVLR